MQDIRNFFSATKKDNVGQSSEVELKRGPISEKQSPETKKQKGDTTNSTDKKGKQKVKQEVPILVPVFNLNAKQQQAVESPAKFLRITAGPGTGKTESIAYRVKHFMESCGLNTSNILALTFTKEAKKVLQHRLARLTGKKEKEFSQTKHASGVSYSTGESRRVLQWFLMSAVVDEGDQKQMVKSIMEQYYEKRRADRNSEIAKEVTKDDVEEMLGIINKGKLKGQHAEEYIEMEKHVWQQDERKKDFTDLLFETHTLLETNPQILYHYHRKYTFILCDEFQDTNMIQQKILALLCGKRDDVHLTLIGDPDQSIYSFQGASTDGVADIEESMLEKATKIAYEINYRSTPTIINTFNQFISEQPSSDRISLKPCDATDKGEDISLAIAGSAQIEASIVANDILRRIASEDSGADPYSKFAVLYRQHSVIEEVKSEFQMQGLPYQILGKTIKFKHLYSLLSILDKSKVEAKSILEMFKKIYSLHNIDNELSTLSSLVTKNIDWYSKLAAIVNGSKKTTAKMYNIFEEQFSHFVDTVNIMIEHYKKKEWSHVAAVALQLLRSKDQKLDYFLGIFMAREKRLPTVYDVVALGSIHQAKGKEWDNAYLIHMNQGVMPSARASKKEEEEEEFRLAYVALSRARKTLCITAIRGEKNVESPYLKQIVNCGKLPDRRPNLGEEPVVETLPDVKIQDHPNPPAAFISTPKTKKTTKTSTTTKTKSKNEGESSHKQKSTKQKNSESDSENVENSQIRPKLT